MNWQRFFDGLIEYSFYFLLFIVPLILTPYNYELFEYNKMMLVYLMTVVIVGAWVGTWIVGRRIRIQRTPLDIPIILFLAAQVLSTIFSIDVHTSIWGYYSRFHGGLLSTTSYILLYYAFVSNIREAKTVFNCLYILLSSALLITFYGILEHFGIDAQYWVQDVRNRVFSTLGQPNWLGAWIDAFIFIPIALFLYIKKTDDAWGGTPRQRAMERALAGGGNAAGPVFFLILFFTFYLCLLFTGSRSAYFGFLATFFTYFALFIILSRRAVKKLIPLVTLIIFISLALGTPFTPTIFQFIKNKLAKPAPSTSIPLPPLAQTISSSEDIRRVVWQGALGVWRHWPVFGSGVETFAYSYYNFRPRAHNDLSEWDFLYNKAHNEYLNYLATTGIVGLGTYLLMIGWFIFWCFKKIFNFKFLISNQIPNPKSQNFKKLGIKNYLGQLEIRSIRNSNQNNIFLIIALFSGYFSILVTNFFGFSVVPVALLFWFFPAFVFVLTYEPTSRNPQPITHNPQPITTSQYFFLSIVAFIVFYFLYFICRFWWADYKFATGKKYSDGGYLLQGYQLASQTVSLNSGEPLYHSQLAETAAMIAVVYWQKDSSASAQLVEQLTQQAVTEVQQTLKINKVHINYYKSAAKTFIYLAVIKPAYYQQALKSLEMAAQLSPTDAKIFYNLGLLYQQLNQPQKAQQYLEKTVQLKPNYTATHLTLAKLYHDNKEVDQAINELKFILNNIETNQGEALELLKKWEKK